MRLLLNIDVPDLAAARQFYVEAFGLRDGRRLGDGVLELLGAQAPIYLLQKPTGSLGTWWSPPSTPRWRARSTPAPARKAGCARRPGAGSRNWPIPSAMAGACCSSSARVTTRSRHDTTLPHRMRRPGRAGGLFCRR